ncbi:carbamoyltransferase family protein [Cardinium endosymbiont of Oedothorax gibbosus]|uniref:carbamoyltransferase family protein n=1 Tax=Cardinium endosymbiont of Oedothorax gibbosus TaxID=931101 RepID=UPI002024539A|nr:carbamoyltransferase C-terminal domain-containing protein [Cardinium endosymbiont of Oedothorax gibbosus]CAH2559761.1 Putative Carbamoyltransferase [Cardinium endosymbiont of Oedothorax gibbosus]
MKTPTYILGINHTYHELSAAIIRDGILVSCIEEERLSRIKHGKDAQVDNPNILPIASIDYCLKSAGIQPKEIDCIGISFEPRQRLRNIDIDPYYEHHNWGSKMGEELFVEKLMQVPDLLSAHLEGYDKSNIKWIPHHICHAASAFFVSPYDEAAIICIDGIGEFASTWLGQGKGNNMSVLKEINYPNSLGFLWEKISKFLGFSDYDAAKVMGLSAYGNPDKFHHCFQQLLSLERDGTFSINNDITRFRLEDFHSLEELFKVKKVNNLREITSAHRDIAAGMQKITNDTMLHLAKYIANATKSTYLCLAGGVALNCVANHEILKSKYFESIYIQPASNDAGTALGAAFQIWNSLMGNQRTYVMDHSYTSSEYGANDIEHVLRKEELHYNKITNIEEVVAELLAEGDYIIGWFQGKMEWGPRALGNRSLLADPRNAKMKDILNLRIKKRESFRPFAPSVLEEYAQEWFKIPDCCDSISKQFMLFTFPVHEDKIPIIPAVVHVNNTSRVQLVNKRTNPRYYHLIAKFLEKTGVPMILNTSFNDNEPIVCTPLDAVNTFKKTEMDYLVMDNFLVHR